MWEGGGNTHESRHDVPPTLTCDLAEFVELQAHVLAVAGGAHPGVERGA